VDRTGCGWFAGQLRARRGRGVSAGGAFAAGVAPAPGPTSRAPVAWRAHEPRRTADGRDRRHQVHDETLVARGATTVARDTAAAKQREMADQREDVATHGDGGLRRRRPSAERRASLAGMVPVGLSSSGGLGAVTCEALDAGSPDPVHGFDDVAVV